MDGFINTSSGKMKWMLNVDWIVFIVKISKGVRVNKYNMAQIQQKVDYIFNYMPCNMTRVNGTVQKYYNKGCFNYFLMLV